MERWLVVLDEDDDVSQKQLQVCRDVKPALRGAVVCTRDEKTNDALCYEVRHFPAFCNVDTNMCTYGLRPDAESLDALVTAPSTIPPPTLPPNTGSSST